MKINWEISDDDIQKVHDVVAANKVFVSYRMRKNVERKNFSLTNDAVLKSLTMCLLSSQQASGPNSPIKTFLDKKPFPLTAENLQKEKDVSSFVQRTLQENGLTRFKDKIPKWFTLNYEKLSKNNWQIIDELTTDLHNNATKAEERVVADRIDDLLIGFGPKQARNFLQDLGLTKYEILIDSRIANWLKSFQFPLSLNPGALQDKVYYHFICDGIQELCERAGVFPCVLDGAIFAVADKDAWTDENISDNKPYT